MKQPPQTQKKKIQEHFLYMLCTKIALTFCNLMSNNDAKNGKLYYKVWLACMAVSPKLLTLEQYDAVTMKIAATHKLC